MDTLELVTGAEAELVHMLVAAHSEFATGAVEPKFLLDNLLGRTQALTDATGCLLEVAEDEEMVCLSASGAAEDLRRTRTGQNTVAGMVTRTGLLLRCFDTQTDERIDAETSARLEARSLVAAPVYSSEGFAGALTVFFAAPEAFDDSVVQTVQVVAGMIGMSMTRIASSIDTSEHRGLEVLQYPALHDPLTQLPNRTLLFDRLQQAIQLAHREREPLALLAFDLDGFEQFNEDRGHDAGDVLLRSAASCIVDTLRASDTIARAGGDEFAVLLPGANAIGALGTANKLLRRLAHDDTLGERCGVTATIGIAIYPDHGEEAGELLEHATQAVQQARNEGRSHRVYSE